MELTFLGTGSAMPTGRRFQSGTLLTRDAGDGGDGRTAGGASDDGDDGDGTLLVDCGSGVLHGLARTEVGYEGIDAVLLTHHHLDHVADLLPLVKARWLAGAEELTVAGPPGTTELVEDLLSVHEYMQDRIDLTLRDVEEEFTIAGFEANSMETRHSMQCFAYWLTPDVDSDGEGIAEGAVADPPTVALSGDSEAFADLAAFADGATVFVHECSFPDDVDVSNHPTPTQLGEALAAADPDVDRVYLNHLYPHTEGRHEAMLDSIAAAYDGDVRFAEDGLTLQLGPARSE